eukprot:scaffold9978_cov117-Skeletonema_menzelii.AAC.7
MAAEYYIFTGMVGDVIPRHVTHVRIDKSLKVVPARAFYEHPNIEEVECHDGIERIEAEAFYYCPSLRRVIMPGVKVIEQYASYKCLALTSIDCGKLEILVECAFGSCRSLSIVDLPYIRILERAGFSGCTNLTSVKFGKDLESIGEWAFAYCPSLERITLPLKDGMIASNSIVRRCVKLNRVELVGGVHETVAALLLEEWKNDVNEEIDAINRFLPNIPYGSVGSDVNEEIDAINRILPNIPYGSVGRTKVIRAWIRSVLRKIVHYKAEHRRYLNEAAATLFQSTLPLPNEDIVFKNIIPFLELPSYTFEGED